MGAILDCFRGSTNEQAPLANNNKNTNNNADTPDPEARRQAALEAANRRLIQNEKRGVDEDQLLKLKQREAERERLEQKHAQLSKQISDNSGGLKWQVN